MTDFPQGIGQKVLHALTYDSASFWNTQYTQQNVFWRLNNIFFSQVKHSCQNDTVNCESPRKTHLKKFLGKGCQKMGAGMHTYCYQNNIFLFWKANTEIKQRQNKGHRSNGGSNEATGAAQGQGIALWENCTSWNTHVITWFKLVLCLYKAILLKF